MTISFDLLSIHWSPGYQLGLLFSKIQILILVYDSRLICGRIKLREILLLLCISNLDFDYWLRSLDKIMALVLLS